jgi:hypothetical protein
VIVNRPVIIQSNVDFAKKSDVQGSSSIPSAVNFIRKVGYLAQGDGGAALYKRAGSEPSHPGKIQDANNIWWENADAASGAVLDVRQFGLLGSTDDTDALQELVDAFKGRHFLIPSGTTLTTKGLVLDDSTYDDTRITIEGTLKLYADPAGALTTGGVPVYCAILIKDCDGVRLDIPGMLDCNGAAHLATSQSMHGLVIAGATGFRSDILNIKEIKTGDGIYITMKSFNTTSTRTSDFQFGSIRCVNAANGGRNALTIIDAIGGTIGQFFSWNVGGLIDSARQPGGIDFEPNTVDQLIEEVVVNNAYVRHQGSGGITVMGDSRNVRFENFISINDVAASANDGLGNPTQAPGNCSCFTLHGTHDVYARGTCKYENGFGLAAIISNSRNPDIRLNVDHVQIGARIGSDVTDSAGDGVIGGRIEISVNDVCRYGIQEGRVSDAQLVYHLPVGATSGYYGSPFGVIYLAESAAHENVRNVTTLNAVYSANWNRLRRKDNTLGPIFDGTNVLTGSIETGYNETQLFGTAVSGDELTDIRRDMKEITHGRSAIPTLGYWSVGQMIDLTCGARIACSVAGRPGTWNTIVQTPGVQTLATDAIFTLTPFSSPYETVHTGTLTQDRAVTLSTTGVATGTKFRITRTGAGAFNLYVGTGPLKALATGTWGEFTYSGSAWVLSAYGAL